MGVVDTRPATSGKWEMLLTRQAYADAQGVNSIPRNWVVAVDGKVMFEGVGFGYDGQEWMKKATEVIEKVKGTN